ncbi:MAG: hypothetical protein CMI54_04805 [Parcubacteria group bacterium]|nr:hypothetical protein [Parcubacteria group bacterium]|tara:strand:- start:30916 stop:31221 length:306 start_codon:yes stop_codon:yes gene_type:complete
MKRKFPKITKYARGQECQIRIYPYCNGNPETTVFCHAYSEDKGVGLKSPDYWGAFGCSTCHDIVDGRMRIDDMSLPEIHKAHIDGIYRTLKILFNDEVIKV